MNKLTLFLMLVVFMPSAWSFTLLSNRVRFASDKIALIGASNDCVNAGVSATELLDIAEKAAEDTWNQVSTANMELEKSGITSADTSADTLNAAINKSRVNAILIGCSSNTTLFTSASTLAVGSIGSGSSGAVGIVLINDALIGGVNRVSTLPRNELEATLAHEIGHALGIGHSSDPVALMYYSIGDKTQENLAQDDWDALTYLYPHENLPGACGTIGNSNPSSWWISLCLGLFFVFLVIQIGHRRGRRFAS